MPSLDSKFEEQFLENIPEKMAEISDYLVNRSESMPPYNYGTTANPFPTLSDSEAVRAFFNTDDAYAGYTRSIKEPENEDFNKVSVRIGYKLQADVISTLERDFKSANCSRIKAVCMEAGRLRKNSGVGGAVHNSMAQFVKSFYTMVKETNQ